MNNYKLRLTLITITMVIMVIYVLSGGFNGLLVPVVLITLGLIYLFTPISDDALEVQDE